MLSGRRRIRAAEVNAVAWFIGQSILIIVAAFLLGILVGWLIWGRTLRLKRTAPAEAETQVSAQTSAQTPMPAEAQEAAEPEPVKLGASEPDSEPEPAGAPEPVTAQPEAVPVAVNAEAASAARLETAAAQPVAAAVATLEPAVPDDLERIEGIGPKMAGALAQAGIRTYTQLAAADEATLRQAIESQGMRFAPSLVTWGRQAQLLADGDEEGFADLTRRLVAGRDEGRE
jgi:predicted flap endonuclease-1-like 5' DNA nuclease